MTEKWRAEIERKYGKGAIKTGSEIRPRGYRGTGSISLDVALGGGWGKRSIVQLMGKEGCLDASTFIACHTRAADGKVTNTKGATIERLYNRLHGGPTSGTKPTPNVHYTVASVDEFGRFVHNTIVDVVESGRQLCYEVVADNGFRIVSTADHKFYNGSEYVPLSALSEGDIVLLHTGTVETVSVPKRRASRKYLFVKAHASAGLKHTGKYKYYQLLQSHAVIEAQMNALTLEQYVRRLNTGDIAGLLYLPSSVEVHHIDTNPLNDSIANLEVLTTEEHAHRHHSSGPVSYYVPQVHRIAKIQMQGFRQTYDIVMSEPYRNFVAQGFVVHNSGKTLLFDMAAIEAQRVEGLRSLIFDFEGAYDKKRFQLLGGDLNLLDVIDHESVNGPMLFAEDAFDICKNLFKADSPHACICFDSTGAMVSIHQYDAKEEGGQAKQTMYSLPRVMSEGLPVIGGTLFKSHSEPTVFFVSQGRDNIGGMVIRGIPPRDKQTGGRALPFFAITRVSCSKGDVFKADVTDTDTGRAEKGVEVGHKTKVAVWKNKANRTQGRIAEFDVYNEGEVVGIDRIEELAQLAVYTRVIQQAGSWYEIRPAVTPGGPPAPDIFPRYQGIEKLKAALGDPVLFSEVDSATRRRLGEMMDNAPPAFDPTETEDVSDASGE